ncbi:hypothetical protein DPMN_164606 [Dreissena polymorpha]|uniref:Uncharacterized protein n=1 Tax=Dreissena polymorpha TaxID=45954 RepID=A0A9D4IVK3_DREPO|nr:hypothetical protein DPMN_164606 [Dreissena polymorpha]
MMGERSEGVRKINTGSFTGFSFVFKNDSKVGFDLKGWSAPYFSLKCSRAMNEGSTMF